MSKEVQIISINCQSCAAPLTKSKDHCKCNYCGCINIILQNGKTRLAIGDYYRDGKNINPAKKEKKPIDKRAILLYILFGIVAGALVLYFLTKYKSKKV